MTLLREPVVDFLPSIDAPVMRLFIANPSESFNWAAYVNPFRLDTWGVLCLSLVVLPPIASYLIVKGE